MKRFFLFLLLVGCFQTSVSHAQSATPQLWRTGSPAFSTPSELRSLAKLYENDSRVSYYLILRAFNKGKAASKFAVLTYYDLYQAHPNNVRVQAAFAFASYMATDYNLEGSPPSDPELRHLSWQALNLRPGTVAAYPKDATILLMAARPTYYLNMFGIKENLPDMKRGVSWAKKAARYDPDWIDAQYWLAHILQYYAMNNPITATKETDKNIARQSIDPALKALRLGTQAGDRATQIGCWSLLASGYSYVDGREQTELFYLNKYIAALPRVVKERQRESLTLWHRDVVNRISGAKPGTPVPLP